MGYGMRFLEDPSILPINNPAERDLRSGVTARKVSQCSKTQRGADGYAMIKSLSGKYGLLKGNDDDATPSGSDQ
jgi:hypothetical protein